MKKYHYNQSPLYRLRSKKKLSDLLNTPLSSIQFLAKNNSNFKVFDVIGKNNKPREVQVPKKLLEALHRRLFILLSRLETPDYLHSGTKKRSHITNAQSHKKCIELSKLDIKSFFQSITRDSVYRFFNKTMECSPDVSEILSGCCTYDGHIPTGSKISQALAFHCNKDLFDKINGISNSYESVFTCYVDDLTFSGSSISKQMIWEIKKQIHRSGYSYHKESNFKASDPKVVTGVVIHRNELYVLNRHHKAIYDLREKYDSGEITLSEIDSLKGMLNSAGQINEKFKIFSSLY
ncbi:MAG: RNA-directed DNA polymerase [Gammaproteobacteria bacterium]|nr:RNA-directed DNA polymerase [Gammaproteobacteria bacterium]